MPLTVARDPVARGAYTRFPLGNSRQGYTCDWCGQSPPRLYSYVWWNDDKAPPVRDSGHWFCNLICFHDYYDIRVS